MAFLCCTNRQTLFAIFRGIIFFRAPSLSLSLTRSRFSSATLYVHFHFKFLLLIRLLAFACCVLQRKQRRRIKKEMKMSFRCLQNRFTLSTSHHQTFDCHEYKFLFGLASEFLCSCLFLFIIFGCCCLFLCR